MCNQMGFKQIMCVYLSLSFFMYVWFLSRKIMNRRAHSYFGNTTVYRCPVCDKPCKSLAGLKRHERYAHAFTSEPTQNNSLFNYFSPKKKEPKSKKRKRKEPDASIRWGAVQKKKRKKKASEQHRKNEEINAKAKKESSMKKVPAEREHPLKVNVENDVEPEGARCSGDHVEGSMEVEDDPFHDLIDSADEEVIGDDEVSKDDAPKNDDSDHKKSEARARTDVENPEDPGDDYRRVLNVKIQEVLNLIDHNDVAFKFELYQEIRSIVTTTHYILIYYCSFMHTTFEFNIAVL